MKLRRSPAVGLLLPVLFLAAFLLLRAFDGGLPVVHAATGFAQGNLVVYRVGDGSAPLSSNATPVFLDEYTPSGVLVQSIPLPTSISGINKRLTASGTATSEGELARSVDGKYLTAAGYDVAVGTASITGSSSSSVNRVIARVDAAGAVDTTTALSDAATGSNPRGAVSTDGTNLWIDGGAGGIRFATFGTTTSVQLSSTVTNLRQVNIFEGQLYVSSASGSLRLGNVGTGIPTASGQTITQLPGIPTNLSSPYGFFFAHLSANGSSVDTVYIADDSTSSGGILKYSLVGGSWVSNGSVGTSLGVRSLTGAVQNGSVVLYVTSSSGFFTITDSNGYNSALTGSLVSLASAGTSTAFRGIAFAPLSSGPTNPSGLGAANPSAIQAGSSTILTVRVTPGASPTSSGVTVSGDLSAIGGSATQQFFDDGTHGDAGAGDGVFSFQATVDAATNVGNKTLGATISDAQSRNGTASITVTVLPSTTPPLGVGTANPGSLQEGNTTLLTVKVTPGSNPTSTGISVMGDLHLLGGSSAQQFADDGTHGDVIPGDNIFSYQIVVASGTSPGTKPLPITVADIQSRSSSTAILLVVQPPPPPTTVKISQVYGGGGNSGATYTNDFIEIFNQASTSVDLTGWSVQYNSAGTTSGLWQTTSICPQGTCILPARHYFLVQESQGAGGTTALPAADALGTIAMSGANGKVALVASTNPLDGACPAGTSLVDLVGYGSANCFETTATPSLTNTTAAVRKGNGCIDTDNNAADFVTIGPIPRNSAASPNSCGDDPSKPSALGIATPSSLEPASQTLLTFKLAPAINPPSTGLTVSGDLTSIGGITLQPFYDDQTHGDEGANDKIFSFQATVGPFVSTGAKTIVGTITDEEGRTEIAPITLTILSPTCGVERWSVKVGVDPDAPLVNLSAPIRTTIADLRAIPAPAAPPDNARVQPTETSVYVVNGTMILFKKETDVDYHVVVQDDDGNTIVTEIPSPACVITSGTPRVPAPSPFSEAIASARQEFDTVLQASPVFQSVSIPVQIKGVGFFDFIHGQAGVAPNGIELHPILDLKFTRPARTTLTSSNNPSVYGQTITITATVSNGGANVPTGSIGFFEGSSPVSNVALDQNGQATFTTSGLSVGSHSFTAHYEGDSTTATNRSSEFSQAVNKADQTISFGPLAERTYGAAPFPVAATGGGSTNPVMFDASGNCTSSGGLVVITGAGSCTVTASQAGDSNYSAAPDVSRSFIIKPAPANITISGYSGVYDGQAHGALGSARGIHGEDLSSLLNLGASFTDAPGGTAMWSFAGATNYAAGSGSVNITIAKATPSFSNLAAPAITVGTASSTLFGKVSYGSLIPTGAVAITLNGITQNALIQAAGGFSSPFATASLRPTNPPYSISYTYSGDTNFNAMTGTGSLTVNYGISPLYAQTKAAKSGSTIPIKLELTNTLGANLSSSSITVSALRLAQISTNATSDVQDAGNANPELNFRYDATIAPGGGYIFNLSTKGLATGTWQLIFSAGNDPTPHAIMFQVQ